MYQLIQISTINDFLFCPYSIYLHSIYYSFCQDTYHGKTQIVGKLKHENIETSKYSSSTRYLQGLPVYSEKYKVVGKIDIYDVLEKALIERKYKVSKIYDGYKYQLYAQYFGMIEKDYEVRKMFIHSLKDNKRYTIKLPKGEELHKFEKVVNDMWNFSLEAKIKVNKNKCLNCIYSNLCRYAYPV